MKQFPVACCILAFLAGFAPTAEPAAPASSLARMPIREVTVFKDGHAFVVHQGAMPTDAAGNVVMDYLPTPVLGTFWPYAPDKKATLHSVGAGRRRVLVEHTAMNIRDLLEANPGAEVIVSEGKDAHYPATIVRFLSRSAEELDRVSPTTAGENLPQKGNLLLLKTADGTRAVPVERITDVKFVGKYQTLVTDEEYRNLLTMKLDWGGKPPEKTAEVGMAYVQKGIRWIPNYRIELDGKGKANVKLQATLLNEMTDLENATVHLVIGVPTFYFKDTQDPIALSQAMAHLSPYFQTDASTQFALSNSMMTQVARGGEMRGGGGGIAQPRADLGPDIGGGEKSEDLFLFTVKNVTLKKGASMVGHADSFAMIRGGHLDLCVLGSFEVAANGDFANWTTSLKSIPAVGGAMDLAVGAQRIWLLMDHTSKDGKPKLLETCTMPLTAVGVVKRVYTNLAVIDVTARGFELVEAIPGLSFEDLQARTGAKLHKVSANAA